MKEIYRKSALERLSTPDQLDKALRITSPLSWIALLAIAALIAAAGVWSVKGTLPVTITANAIIATPVGTNAVYSDVSGTVIDLYVGVGDVVYAGETKVARVQTLTQDYDVVSDQNGVVSDVVAETGKAVGQNGEVVRLSPLLAYPDSQVVVCYVPYGKVKSIRPDMKVYVTLEHADSQKYGHMQALVRNVDARACTTAGMEKVLGSGNNLSSSFTGEGAVCAVTCELYPDGGTASGYWWSNEKGREQQVSTGSICTAKIILEEVPPISKLITKLSEVLGGN